MSAPRYSRRGRYWRGRPRDGRGGRAAGRGRGVGARRLFSSSAAGCAPPSSSLASLRAPRPRGFTAHPRPSPIAGYGHGPPLCARPAPTHIVFGLVRVKVKRGGWWWWNESVNFRLSSLCHHFACSNDLTKERPHPLPVRPAPCPPPKPTPPPAPPAAPRLGWGGRGLRLWGGEKGDAPAPDGPHQNLGGPPPFLSRRGSLPACPSHAGRARHPGRPLRPRRLLCGRRGRVPVCEQSKKEERRS